MDSEQNIKSYFVHNALKSAKYLRFISKFKGFICDLLKQKRSTIPKLEVISCVGRSEIVLRRSKELYTL